MGIPDNFKELKYEEQVRIIVNNNQERIIKLESDIKQLKKQLKKSSPRTVNDLAANKYRKGKN